MGRPLISARAPASLLFGPQQGRDKAGWRHDVVGTLSQIQDGAVDVQKESGRPLGESLQIIYGRVHKGRRGQSIHQISSRFSPHVRKILGDSVFAVWPDFHAFSLF